MKTDRHKLTSVLQHWVEVFKDPSMQDFTHLKREAGLSMSQLITRFRLYHAEECSVSDISEWLGNAIAAASQIVESGTHDELLAMKCYYFNLYMS